MISTFGVASCGSGEDNGASAQTESEIASGAYATAQPAPTTTIAPNLFALDDLPDAHTTLAAADTEIFTDYGYGGDLVASEFTCDALAQVASFEFVICAIGGTTERQFALVVGDEYVSREQDTATTSLLYQLFQPVPHKSGTRAVKVRSGYKRHKLDSFDSYELTVRSVSAGAVGTALSLHYQLFGSSRTWNAIEMIGLNEFGSAEVVATFTGEGVADYADGRGFIFTNYHYADNEPMCCPTYYAINYFRPGSAGWTHSMQTVPNDPDKEMDTEMPFRDMLTPTLIAKYNFARAKSNDE
jgi:hypothetical protein